MKIYKYSNLESASKIIEQERVLLNSPYNFKDITDSLINISPKAQKKTIKLIENYGMFKFLYDFIYSLNLSKPFRGKALVKWVKWEITLYLKTLNIEKIYTPMRMLNFIYFLLKAKLPALDELTKEAEYLYANKTIPNIVSLRQKARISCFSKTSTNMYCWNEHANGHNGVCIEFEEERPFFKEVEYSSKNEEMDIYNSTAKILAYNVLKQELTYHEKQFADTMLRPFFVKNISYKPEDEIRCLLSDKESENIGYVVEGSKTFLKMKITRVFIGCRIPNSQELLDFLKLCDKKGIPISYVNFEAGNKRLVALTNTPETVEQ